MSVMNPVAIVPTALLLDRGLSNLCKAVAGLVFASGQGAERWCDPKQGEMAEALGASRESVNRAIRKLVTEGWVETRARTESGRGRQGLEYRLKLDITIAPQEAVIAQEPERHIGSAPPDVTRKSQKRTPTGSADVTAKSQQTGAEVTPASQKPADVTATSQAPAKENSPDPYKKTTSLRSVEENLPLVSLAEAGSDPRFEGFKALWDAWRGKDLIRRSRRGPSFDAFRAVIRAGAKPERIAAGVRAYLANPDKTKDRGNFMLGFAKWLTELEFEDWADEAANGEIISEDQLRLRLMNYDADGSWLDKWGDRNGPLYAKARSEMARKASANEEARAAA